MENKNSESLENTKICSKCGMILPKSDFGINSQSKDGLRSMCKECCREYNKEHRQLYARSGLCEKTKIKKVYSNPDLAHFTPRQLIDELRQRGYHGTLSIQQEVRL